MKAAQQDFAAVGAKGGVDGWMVAIAIIATKHFDATTTRIMTDVNNGEETTFRKPPTHPGDFNEKFGVSAD